MVTTKELINNLKQTTQGRVASLNEAVPVNKNQKKVPKDFDLLEAIRSEKIYKSNVIKRDRYARKWINENCTQYNNHSALPGAFLAFNYFEPKTKEELEYYDAMPCAIFFARFKTQKGEWRVLAWNVHYYPPRIRYQVLTRVYEIYKPFYANNWIDPVTQEISMFNYKLLMAQLDKNGLGFGVREYIPNLMRDIRPVPIKGWSIAVFTEGRFKKRTKEQIMNYWAAYKNALNNGTSLSNMKKQYTVTSN